MFTLLYRLAFRIGTKSLSAGQKSRLLNALLYIQLYLQSSEARQMSYGQIPQVNKEEYYPH